MVVVVVVVPGVEGEEEVGRRLAGVTGGLFLRFRTGGVYTTKPEGRVINGTGIRVGM